MSGDEDRILRAAWTRVRSQPGPEFGVSLDPSSESAWTRVRSQPGPEFGVSLDPSSESAWTRVRSQPGVVWLGWAGRQPLETAEKPSGWKA